MLCSIGVQQEATSHHHRGSGAAYFDWALQPPPRDATANAGNHSYEVRAVQPVPAAADGVELAARHQCPTATSGLRADHACGVRELPPCDGAGGEWKEVSQDRVRLDRVDRSQGSSPPKQIRGEEWNDGPGSGAAEVSSNIEWVLPWQSANASCLYNPLAVKQALCQLKARFRRIAFVGDSLLRNYFENFALLDPDVRLQQLDPESINGRNGRTRLKQKWGDFWMRSGRGREALTNEGKAIISPPNKDISLVFHWAPLIPPPTDPATLLISPRLFNRTMAGVFAGGSRNQSGAADAGDGLCRYVDAETDQSWMTFCEPPDVLLLNIGLWHTQVAPDETAILLPPPPFSIGASIGM